MTFLIIFYVHIDTQCTVLCYKELLIARHRKSYGSGVGVNVCAVPFHKTCVHLCIHYSENSVLHYWKLLQCMFRIVIGGVHMRSKIPSPPPFSSCFPVDFSWHAYSMYVILLRDLPSSHLAESTNVTFVKIVEHKVFIDHFIHLRFHTLAI
jgi:hypothetical protein